MDFLLTLFRRRESGRKLTASSCVAAIKKTWRGLNVGSRSVESSQMTLGIVVLFADFAEPPLNRCNDAYGIIVRVCQNITKTRKDNIALNQKRFRATFQTSAECSTSCAETLETDSQRLSTCSVNRHDARLSATQTCVRSEAGVMRTPRQICERPTNLKGTFAYHLPP